MFSLPCCVCHHVLVLLFYSYRFFFLFFSSFLAMSLMLSFMCYTFFVIYLFLWSQKVFYFYDFHLFLRQSPLTCLLMEISHKYCSFVVSFSFLDTKYCFRFILLFTLLFSSCPVGNAHFHMCYNYLASLFHYFFVQYPLVFLFSVFYALL